MATTTAIDFGALVGAQLAALIEAEAEAAEKSAEYIENVGFEKLSDGTLKLRMVTFEMSRRDVDGEVRKHIIQVPVITLVPIPLLTIEEAQIDFDLQVESVVQEKTNTSNGNQKPTIRDSLVAKSAISKARPRARLMSRLARTQKRSETKTTTDLSMKVKIAQSPFPLGIERLLNTADLSVEDNTDG